MFRMYLNSKITAIIIFIITSLIFVSPMFSNFNNIGVMDWDILLFYNEVARKTVLDYHQFPFWNPYYCGGNIFLAHPESSFLSPLFLFVLLFGSLYGLKIAMISHLILGLFFMFLLCRYIKLGLYPSYLASFLYMLSGQYIIRLSVGHVHYLTMAFYPIIFLFFLKSINNYKYIIISSIILSVTFFYGTIYELFSFILFLIVYSILYFIFKRDIIIIKNLIFLLLFFFLLSSIKLVPVLDNLNQSSRLADFALF